jgi:formylglycine-generating enzyme required for sulfatase activity
LDVIVLKSLSKSPLDRYSDAGALADELETVLAGHAPRAMTSWARRHAKLLIVALFLTVAVATPLYLYGIRKGHANEQFVNSLGMRFARVPAGMFFMGSPPDEGGRREDERCRTVRITRPFQIQATEVTREQYVALMPAPTSWGSKPLDAGRGNWPADFLTWNDAITFCGLLSQKENKHYRLPTEAEWEYAARAGVQHGAFEQKKGDSNSWMSENSGGHVHAVAEKQPNKWGLFDVSGNAAEWCSDFYESDHHEKASSLAVDPTGPASGATHVVKGGNAFQPKAFGRFAARDHYSADTSIRGMGFRIVLED